VKSEEFASALNIFIISALQTLIAKPHSQSENSPSHHLPGENALQLFCREAQLELTTDGYGDAARLLGHHNGYAVALVGDA